MSRTQEIKEQIQRLETIRDDLKEKLKQNEFELQKQHSNLSESLLIDFYNRYGESAKTIAINYILFLKDAKRKRIVQCYGHKFRIPSYCQYSDKIEYRNDWGRHAVIAPAHYKDCILTEKIKDAFTALGFNCVIDPTPQEYWESLGH